MVVELALAVVLLVKERAISIVKEAANKLVAADVKDVVSININLGKCCRSGTSQF